MGFKDIAPIRHREESGFISYNNIKLVSIDTSHCTLEVPLSADTENVWGTAHGGLIFTLADTAAGALGRMLCSGENLTTDASIHYYRSTSESKKLSATSKVCKLGKNLAFFSVSVEDELHREIAVAEITMFFVRGH